MRVIGAHNTIDHEIARAEPDYVKDLIAKVTVAFMRTLAEHELKDGEVLRWSRFVVDEPRKFLSEMRAAGHPECRIDRVVRLFANRLDCVHVFCFAKIAALEMPQDQPPTITFHSDQLVRLVKRLRWLNDIQIWDAQ